MTKINTDNLEDALLPEEEPLNELDASEVAELFTIIKKDFSENPVYKIPSLDEKIAAAEQVLHDLKMEKIFLEWGNQEEERIINQTSEDREGELKREIDRLEKFVGKSKSKEKYLDKLAASDATNDVAEAWRLRKSLKENIQE